MNHRHSTLIFIAQWPIRLWLWSDSAKLVTVGSSLSRAEYAVTLIYGTDVLYALWGRR